MSKACQSQQDLKDHARSATLSNLTADFLPVSNMYDCAPIRRTPIAWAHEFPEVQLIPWDIWVYSRTDALCRSSIGSSEHALASHLNFFNIDSRTMELGAIPATMTAGYFTNFSP